MERAFLEALVVGLCIGIAALLLNHWLNDNSWRMRIVALLAVGTALCVFQYALARWRRR